MISNLSKRLPVILCDYIEKTTEVDYVRYGIETIIRGLIKFLTLFITAYILGLLLPMVIVVFTFSFFRFLTGGHHYSTYRRCLFAGLLSMLAMSFLATKLAFSVGNLEILSLICFSVFVGLFLSYQYAPSNHFYKKITDAQKSKLKNYSLIGIIIWALIMYYLIFRDSSNEIILASIFGFLFQIGTIHPVSYQMVNKVESLLERRINL